MLRTGFANAETGNMRSNICHTAKKLLEQKKRRVIDVFGTDLEHVTVMQFLEFVLHFFHSVHVL